MEKIINIIKKIFHLFVLINGVMIYGNYRKRKLNEWKTDDGFNPPREETFLYDAVLYIHKITVCKNYDERVMREWRECGKPVPPPELVKRNTIREYAKKYSIKVFIETGTYSGATIYAVKDVFRRIFSIELGAKLYEGAKKRFARFPHISIIHGDSGIVLPEIISHLSEPCLFYLDAHFCEGRTAKGEKITPIIKELVSILKHPVEGHVILIDDARAFLGDPIYPTYPPLKKLEDFVHQFHSDWVLEVEDDIIRAHKKRQDIVCSAFPLLS